MRHWFLILLLLPFLAPAAEPQRNLSVQRSASGPSEKRVALVIGNSAYHNSPLKNPVNDAKDMSARLRQLGFEVIERTNLGTRQIGATLREFRSKLAPGAVALVFYAGHGLQIKGDNYLPTVDAEISSEEDVPNQSLAVRQLLDLLDESKTRLNLVFLDACRNNPYARSFRSAGDGLAKISAPSGTLISFATRPGSVAADGSGRNGLYTSQLLEQMTNTAQPIEFVLKRVVTGVKSASKGRQEPWMEGSIEGDFCFGDCGSGSAVASPVAGPDPAAIELAFWDSVKESRNASEYQAYINQYPSGRFAGLARARVASFAQPAALAPTQTAMPVPSPSVTASVASRPSAAPDLGFPRKPVRLVVPWPPGGLTDAVARTLATRLSALAGQPVVIENRAGAAGNIGADAIAKAAPDGYSLLLGSSGTLAVNSSLYANIPFDAQGDFAPIAYLGDVPVVLVVSADSPVRSTADLVRRAKAQAGVSFASSGNGSSAHLLAELFKTNAGIRLQHVPFKGSAPAFIALIEGHVEAMFGDVSLVLPQIRSGKLRALGIAAAARSPLLPDVPTLAEGGYQVSGSPWIGLYAPARTPPAVVARLNLLVYQALADAEVRSRLSDLGFNLATAAAPDLLADIQRSDSEKWRRLIQSAGIRVD